MRGRSSIDLVIEDPRWTETLPEAEALAERGVAAAFARADFGEEVSLCVMLADDSRIQVLNRDFRGIDRPTNVLSFPSQDTPLLPGEPRMVGDIALAYDTLAREANDANKTFRNHFIHLIVHASLHLIGYTHDMDEDAERMEALEIAALSGLDVPNPYEESGDSQITYGTREP